MEPLHFYIVHPDPSECAALRESLNSAAGPGCRFSEATTGEEALRGIEEFQKQDTPLDCILLSDGLEGVGSLEMLQALHDDTGSPSFPIVVVLTGGDATSGLNFLKAGAQDYFDLKTLGSENLAKIIENAIERFALAGEQIRQFQKVTENEDFLRRVLDNLFAFVGVLLPDGTLVNANEAPLKIAGISEKEVLGKKFWDCFWWNYSQETQDRLRDAIAKARDGEVVRYDERVQIEGGTMIWIDFQLALLRDEKGRITHLIPSGMDISERRTGEESERESRHKLRAVFDGTKEFVVLLDPDGVLLEANSSALSISGKSHEEVVGRPLWETFWFDQSQEAATAIQTAVRSAAAGKSATFELEIVNFEGELQLFDFSFSPVLDEAGQTSFVVPVGVDITELKQAEITLRENDQRLRLATAATSVGIWALNVNTGELNWDDQMFKIYGMEPTEDGLLEHATWQQSIDSQDVLTRSESLIEEVRQRGQGKREFSIRRQSDNETRIIQAVEAVRISPEGETEWIVGTNLDITERRRRETNLAFIGDIQAGLAELKSEDELMQFATTRIAEHLGVAHCTTFEVLEKNKSAVVLHDHFVEGAVEMSGEIPLESFLTDEEIDKINVGEPMSVDDVSSQHRPDWMAESFETLGIGAVANASHIAKGRSKFLLHVSHSKPYRWQRSEIALLTELCANIYLRLERARTEKALRESEELYRETFEYTAIGMAQLDTEGRWIWVNKAVCEITGYPKEELMALTFSDITHPDDLEEDLTYLQRLTSGEIDTYTIEKRYLRKDQSIVWINLTASILRDSKGKPLRYVAAIEDISGKKGAQQDLENERLFVKRLTQVVPNMLYLFELKRRRIVWVNRHIKDALGYTEQEVIKMGSAFMPSIVHPDDQETVLEHLSNSALSPDGEASEVEYRLKRRDGEWRWFQTHDTPFARDAEGKVTQLIGISVDITDQKANEKTLRETALRKDEFLAMLGHELRNPLGAIRHAVAIEKESADDPAAVEWCRDVVDRQSMQLSRMIEDLLNVARITRGKIPQMSERLDLVEVLKRAVAVGQALTEKGKLTLTTDITDEALSVLGDSARLEQVFVNLLNNAAKYTPEGGEIRLVASRKKDHAVVAIVDTGVGISQQLLPGLFELFRQVETTIDRSQGGLGIGLTVVKSLVDAHGGRVSAASEGKNKGSTFTVKLPLDLTVAEGTTTAVTASVDESTLEKKPEQQPRILIVDDHKDAAQGLSRLLVHRGYEVEIALDGLLGLEAAEKFEPQIFLLDLGLPGIDGFELARRLRQVEKFEKAYMVAISGYAQVSDVAKSREAGFDEHFSKPVEVPKLLSLLNDLSNGSR